MHVKRTTKLDGMGPFKLFIYHMGNIPTIVGLLQKSMFCTYIELEYPKKGQTHGSINIKYDLHQ